MYGHLGFAQDRSIDTVDFDELFELGQEQFSYESHPVKTGQIRITDSGQIIVDGQERQMLKGAFIGLCRRLRIPDPFAKHIPWDLLQHTLCELSKSSNKDVQLFIRNDGVVVNVAQGNFVPVPHEAFLDLFREGMPEITRGSITDVGLQIDVVDPLFGDAKFSDIKVKVGDVVKTGLSFHNSTAGYHFTKALLFLWRLQCTNGMLLPAKIGFAKLRAKSGREISVSLDNFLHQVSELMVDAKKVGSQLRRLNRLLVSPEFSRSWKGLMKIVRDEDFLEEGIFQVTKEQRKLWLAEDRAYKKDQTLSLSDTTVNGYEMLNSVTYKAKQFDQITRRKLEAYGGKIIMGLIGSHNGRAHENGSLAN